MSITKRNGTYYADYINALGRRVRRSLRTSDRLQAQELHDQIKAASWRERYLGEKVEERHTWSEAVDRFVFETAHKRSHDTDLYRLKWINKRLSSLNLNEIDAKRIEKLAVEKRDEGAANATIVQTLGLVRQILKRAVEKWQWIDKIPPITMPHVQNERTRVLSYEEEPRLMRAIPAHWRDPIAFLLQTGLRKSSAIRLEWEHVDLDREIMIIPGSRMKTGQPLGVPLSATAMQILRRNRGRHRTHVFLFRGKPLRDLSNTTWHKALAEAKIEDLVIHDLRRTWATRLASNGCPPDMLARLGGWSSYNMVYRRYAHLAPEAMRDHIEKISMPVVQAVEK